MTIPISIGTIVYCDECNNQTAFSAHSANGDNGWLFFATRDGQPIGALCPQDAHLAEKVT